MAVMSRPAGAVKYAKEENLAMSMTAVVESSAENPLTRMLEVDQKEFDLLKSLLAEDADAPKCPEKRWYQ